MNTPPKRPPVEAKRVARTGRIANIAALLRKVLPNRNPLAGTPDPPPPGTPGTGAGSAAEFGPLPAALREVFARAAAARTQSSTTPSRARPPAGIREDRRGRSFTGSFSNHAGRREYKLFVPSGYHGGAIPLIVMLHGCTQSADDFAAGTRMNVLAQEQTLFIVYPEQTHSANISKCWNWFNSRHQLRGEGEPSIIAGITRTIMHDYAVDSRRVYVAGMSAGAAEAAILGATYPDIYAAIGVHSGLPFGAARNLPSALSAMRNGAAVASASMPKAQRIVPAIIFHGDADTTVHPSNGDRLITQCVPPDLHVNVRHDRVSNGHAYTRTEHLAADGTPMFEQWVVHGAGHAWSGGSTAGSYTDPLGPDAAREMLRFFLEHEHPDVELEPVTR